MSHQWLRLWHDMPNDPKFRTIARASKQRIGDVIAIFVHLLVDASSNDEKRGVTQGNAEDVASALDMETEDVIAVLNAMQGRVLDGDALIGWARRQPKREDDSLERVRKYRENNKLHDVTQGNAAKRNVTQRNAPDKDTDTDTDTEGESSYTVKCVPQKRTSAPHTRTKTIIPADWEPSDRCMDLIAEHGIDQTFARMHVNEFVFYWQDRQESRANWDSTFLSRVKTEWDRKAQNPRASPTRGNGKTSVIDFNASALDTVLKQLEENQHVI